MKGVGGNGWEGRLGARTRIKSKAILIRAECSHIYNLCPAIFLTKFVAQLFCLGDILATLVCTCFWFVRTVATQKDAQGERLAVTGGLASLWNTRSANWVGGGSWWIITLHIICEKKYYADVPTSKDQAKFACQKGKSFSMT